MAGEEKGTGDSDGIEELFRDNPPPPPSMSEEDIIETSRYLRRLSDEDTDREQEQIAVYMKYGANNQLAFVMDVLFQHYFTVSKSLEEIAGRAQDGLSGRADDSFFGVPAPTAAYYEMLSFVAIVKGDKESAREYMQKAAELQPRNVVLANFDLAYDVLQAAIPDLNRIRAERYEKEPFELPKHDEMQNT